MSGDTSLQILHKLRTSLPENGCEPASFPDRIIFTSMFNDVTDYGSRKVQGKFLDSAKEVASYAGRFRPG